MRLRRGCKGIWSLLPLIALDRLAKRLAMHYLAPHGVKTAVSGVISWAYTENRGAAFSMLSGRNILLIALSIALIAALALYLFRHPNANSVLRHGLWMIVAGGVGNLYDRIVYGYVVDFIRLDFVDFAIFNSADVFICIGAALTILAIPTDKRKEKKNHG